MRRNHLGTAGQYLPILIFGVALGFGISLSDAWRPAYFDVIVCSKN